MAGPADFCKRKRLDGPTPCYWPECDCEFEYNVEKRKEETLLSLYERYPNTIKILGVLSFLVLFAGLVWLMAYIADAVMPIRRP